MEKTVSLIFLGNLCDTCEKSTNITGSYREIEGRKVREKGRVSQLKATNISVCDHVWLCMCVVKYWICF